MAKKKFTKNYIFDGLGFPVTLVEVELRAHGDDEYPVINTRKLQDTVFDFLIDQSTLLTGAQIAFIRKYMDMTQEEFARSLDLTGHARISQWEKAKGEVAEIRPVYLAALRARMAEFRGRSHMDLKFYTRMVEGHLDAPQKIRIKADAA